MYSIIIVYFSFFTELPHRTLEEDFPPYTASGNFVVWYERFIGFPSVSLYVGKAVSVFLICRKNVIGMGLHR